VKRDLAPKPGMFCGQIIGFHPKSPEGNALKPIQKSTKLANVCYDIRGPVLDRARQMEE